MKIDEVLVAWKARSDELMSGPEAAPRLAHLRDGDGRARRTLLADYFLRPDERIGVLFHTMTPIPDEPITLHNHDFFEVAYLHSGMATHHHASGQMTMLPGDLVFLNPHVRHEVRIHDGACLINLIIRPEIMQQTSAFSLADAPLFAEYVVTYFHLMQRRQDFIHVSRQATGAAQIRGLVESIAIECFRRQPAWESVCVGYFTALFATLSREQAAQVGENDAPRLVTSILKHLEAHRAEATPGVGGLRLRLLAQPHLQVDPQTHGEGLWPDHHRTPTGAGTGVLGAHHPPDPDRGKTIRFRQCQLSHPRVQAAPRHPARPVSSAASPRRELIRAHDKQPNPCRNRAKPSATKDKPVRLSSG